MISDCEFDPGVGATMRANPELATFDSVVDLIAYEGDVTAAQVAALASDLNRIRPKDCLPVRSAFVTHDAHFVTWMQAMTFQFEGREFQLFPTVELADAWAMADPEEA
jgi:hypothetical protein